MAALTNDAIIQILATQGIPVGDELSFFTGAGTTQGTGASFRAPAHRVVTNAVSGAAINMRSLLSNEQSSLILFLTNESANPVNVYPYKGESMNGTANAAFSVTAGNAAVFVGIPPVIARKGGTTVGGTLNWSAALITA